MNVLALHAEAAVTLGVRVGALRKGLFFVSGLLTASAVTSAGSVGFVGLIVPHACRFAFGPDHRILIPAAVLAGGSFLVLCDTLARTVVAPQQLPVGAITAIIGAPVFLYQLHRLRAS
jgi:iron complex transport system permease protein